MAERKSGKLEVNMIYEDVTQVGRYQYYSYLTPIQKALAEVKLILLQLTWSNYAKST
jgi:hypothetical protein